MDVVYFNVSVSSSSVSHNTITHKLTKYGLSKCVTKWIENWLNDCTQRIVRRGTKPSWMQIPTGVSQGSTLRPTLFNIFTDDLDDGVECTLRQSADDTEQGGVADISHECTAIQKWSERNFMKFNKGKSKVLP